MVQTRSDASANRQRLISAARDLFAERGMDAEMKEIAERAGVGIGTIYRNFATKDDLIEAVLNEVTDGFRQATDLAMAEPDPVEAVRLYVANASRVVEEHGGMVRSMLTGHIPACAGQHMDALMADTRMRQVIERGIATGVFRADLDPVVAASALLGLADPIVYLSAQGERTAAEIRDGLTQMYLRGISA